MKAIVRHKYGSPDVLKLEDVPKPSPKENEVLIKVDAASINAMDWRFLKANPFFLRFMGFGLLAPTKLHILGFNVAGRVEAVGEKVDQFQPGDKVFGATNGGGFAEFVCTPANALVLKPANVPFEEAAAAPSAAITAVQGLRDFGNIQAGQKVLIHGASGGVGTFAVQIAKLFGAEVTAVCSTRNVEMARSIGADHVIDYKKADFAKSGKQYDLIFGVNGNRSLFDYRRALSPKGVCVIAGGSGLKQMLQANILGKRLSKSGGKQLIGMETSNMHQEDLSLLQIWLETGKLVPVIDKCYPLSETAKAFQYIEDVHAQGKVVIRMSSNKS